jgi:16S rRNA processing protein RimM
VTAGAGDSMEGNGDFTAGKEVGASGRHDDRKASDVSDHSRAVPAGRVGRAHGLDGSFYVTGARPRLLAVGTEVSIADRKATIARRAGTEEHPIVRMADIEDRPAAEALRGLELTVELAVAPLLEEGEWWAQELEGCEVVDGERHVGTVIGLMELPSCEALEVRLTAPGGDEAADLRRASGGELLVPMVRDAIRRVDPIGRRIDVNMDFLGEA